MSSHWVNENYASNDVEICATCRRGWNEDFTNAVDSPSGCTLVAEDMCTGANIPLYDRHYTGTCISRDVCQSDPIGTKPYETIYTIDDYDVCAC